MKFRDESSFVFNTLKMVIC